MNSPFISVIVPNYCHSKYLEKRLDSIVNQTYENFELIILDDCSPDKGASRVIIEKYRNNSHVSHIVYNEKNSGSTFIQWNRGFGLAKGDYVWVAESDDYAEPTFLEYVVSELSSHERVAIVHTTSFVIDTDSNKIPPYIDGSTMIPYGIYQGSDFIKRYLCLSNGICNASAVIFNKNLAMSVDKSYLTYKASGDHFFWIMLAEKGKVIHISTPLNYFRIHTGKVTFNKSREGVNHKEEYQIYKYLKGKKYIQGLLSFQIFYTFIKQIKHNDYNNEDIRSMLLSLWKNEDLLLYVIARLLLILDDFVFNIKRGFVWARKLVTDSVF